MMKVVRTVWSGGKAGDCIKSLPITIVYGIAITAMAFFTDPTISTLTSGTPSQNADLAGMSFPRRLGVRFHADYIKRFHLTGMQAKWQGYEDVNFEKSLGKDFYHEDLVSREGWAKYYFKGKFPKDVAYVKLEVLNPQTGMLIKTFYFKFTKSYQTSLDGRYFITDPVLDEKIVKNGILTELRPVEKNGKTVYKKGKVTFPGVRMKDISSNARKEKVELSAIIQTMTRYSEKPKMVFLVTPPHLMKYAKLILILIKQLVDLNFDQSYMTKSNQKPLYKTRFMLDELGNLQSEGHGISGFETMLSIGLGQEQQFTLILQTLQQLRDVYGDSVDKIVQGNTSNIVFLKSTDDTMIDTLQKMSGTTHKSFIDSKTVTIDMEKLWLKNEGKVPYTITTREVPVISYNDFAFISERNSIVIRAGDSPIWNRNETILPMSWRLFGNTIKQPGKEYSLQTIPTLSSAIDFDIRRNQPDFNKMFDKRIAQAYEAEESRNLYQKVFGYTEYEMEQLDPDNCADEIMEIINMRVKEEGQENLSSKAVENTEQIEAAKVELAKQQKMDTKIFADKHIAPGDLYSNGRAIHSFDNLFIHAYLECKGDMEQDKLNFNVRNGSLYDRTGSRVYIKKLDETKDFKALHDAGEDPDSNVYDENDAVISNIGSYEVTDAFYEFLARQTSWSFAKGRFDSIVARDFDEA